MVIVYQYILIWHLNDIYTPLTDEYPSQTIYRDKVKMRPARESDDGGHAQRVTAV